MSTPSHPISKDKADYIVIEETQNYFDVDQDQEEEELNLGLNEESAKLLKDFQEESVKRAKENQMRKKIMNVDRTKPITRQEYESYQNCNLLARVCAVYQVKPDAQHKTIQELREDDIVFVG